MILNIVLHPADILNKKTKKVEAFDSSLHQLLDDMYETMVHADGVGLAAPQIGIDQQIAIVETDEENGRLEMINPEIVYSEGEEIGIEGCLSIPNVYGDVIRSYKIRLRAQDRFGEEFEMEAEGFFARAIQHEIDHLHGILFTSKAKRFYTEEELERMTED